MNVTYDSYHVVFNKFMNVIYDSYHVVFNKFMNVTYDSYHVVYINKFMNVTYDSYHVVYINKFMNVTHDSCHVVYINKFMNVTYDYLWYSIRNHRFNWLIIWCCRSTKTQKICHLETILTLDAKHGPQIRFFLHKMNLEQCCGWSK